MMPGDGGLLDDAEGRSRVVAVTGASGKTGRHVVAALRAAGHHVRAQVRSTGALPTADRLDVLMGDMRSVADLVELLAGCDVLYHIPPNMSAAEPQIVNALLGSARTVGLERIVYHSVLHPQIEAMPHHWAKLRVEEQLLACGIDTVILQPAPYVQNLEPYLVAARSGRPSPFPYGAHVVLSSVDLQDVGQAAAAVIVDPTHVGAAYQLCGMERLNAGEVWDRAVARLGLSTPYQRISPEEWRTGPGADLDPRVADWLETMFRYYDEHGLVGSCLPLQALLGRQPRNLFDYIDDFAGDTSKARA